MLFRGIDEATLLTALESPYDISAGAMQGRLVYDANVDGRGIRVVVVAGSDPLLIVTVMFRRVPRARHL